MAFSICEINLQFFFVLLKDISTDGQMVLFGVWVVSCSSSSNIRWTSSKIRLIYMCPSCSVPFYKWINPLVLKFTFWSCSLSIEKDCCTVLKLSSKYWSFWHLHFLIIWKFGADVTRVLCGLEWRSRQLLMVKVVDLFFITDAMWVWI